LQNYVIDADGTPGIFKLSVPSADGNGLENRVSSAGSATLI